LFEDMTAQGADFPQSRSDFAGAIGIETDASLWEISTKKPWRFTVG